MHLTPETRGPSSSKLKNQAQDSAPEAPNIHAAHNTVGSVVLKLPAHDFLWMCLSPSILTYDPSQQCAKSLKRAANSHRGASRKPETDREAQQTSLASVQPTGPAQLSPIWTSAPQQTAHLARWRSLQAWVLVHAEGGLVYLLSFSVYQSLVKA